MIVKKITTGFVVQQFDADTGRCISQEFVASDQVEFTDPKGDRIEDGQYGIDTEALYWPIELKQP
jgi:hypothetical protein